MCALLVWFFCPSDWLVRGGMRVEQNPQIFLEINLERLFGSQIRWHQLGSIMSTLKDKSLTGLNQNHGWMD
uniref:Uncharacterized protein n=1 Tax=Arundo donax TaxID=35708 RepID=A0A0A9AWW1_ARUDO